MIQELYVNHFRCLENFRLTLKEQQSSLLIGKNGVGKTTIGNALEVFQRIGRGTNRVGQLINASDFTGYNTAVPMRFELQVLLKQRVYKYVIAFEFPSNFLEPKVLDEEIWVDNQQLYFRKSAEVTLYKSNKETSFLVDWHLVALPLIQTQQDEPLEILRSWLATMLILSPIPQLIKGQSSGSTLEPKRYVDNFGEWLTGLLLSYPASYALIDRYIRQVIPDFDSLQNELVAKDARNITVQFTNEQGNFSIDFEKLSDGEKCFFLCGVVLAMNKSNDSLFCFWDEPDNYLTISEVQHFITELRRSFKGKGQLLVTSHNAQAIEAFSDENTFFLDRKNHLEPTLCKLLEEIPNRPKHLISGLILGDVAL